MSMAPWAGNKLFEIQSNVSSILAIELIVAGAANTIGSRTLSAGKGTTPALKILNDHCDYDKGDRPLSSEIQKITQVIISGHLLNMVTKSLRLE